MAEPRKFWSFPKATIEYAGGEWKFIWLGHGHQASSSHPADLVQHSSQTEPTLIFHVGRCGSTLLSNLLHAIDRVESINEPSIISTYFTKYVRDSSDCIETKSHVLRAILAALSTSGSAEHDTVIKMPSYALLSGGLLVEALTFSRSLLVIRHPAEVCSSFARQMPDYLLRERGQDMSLCPEGSSAEFDEHEVVAKYVASIFSAAIPISSLTTVCLYDEFVARPLDWVSSLSEHLFQSRKVDPRAVRVLMSLESKSLEPYRGSVYPKEFECLPRTAVYHFRQMVRKGALQWKMSHQFP